MARFDRYDYIGLALAVFLIAIWAAHFILPAPPPLPPPPP
jgi:hypothetical protein